jgi:hypothetical protein
MNNNQHNALFIFSLLSYHTSTSNITFFWVVPWCVNIKCRCFGNMCRLHLHRTWMAYGSDMVVYILRTTSLDRSRANQGEGCGGGGQVGARANGWVEGKGEAWLGSAVEFPVLCESLLSFSMCWHFIFTCRGTTQKKIIFDFHNTAKAWKPHLYMFLAYQQPSIRRSNAYLWQMVLVMLLPHIYILPPDDGLLTRPKHVEVW